MPIVTEEEKKVSEENQVLRTFEEAEATAETVADANDVLQDYTPEIDEPVETFPAPMPAEQSPSVPPSVSAGQAGLAGAVTAAGSIDTEAVKQKVSAAEEKFEETKERIAKEVDRAEDNLKEFADEAEEKFEETKERIDKELDRAEEKVPGIRKWIWPALGAIVILILIGIASIGGNTDPVAVDPAVPVTAPVDPTS